MDHDAVTAYDSAATRARLLDSAYADFVERGLAGARVERIAATAAANKQGIYIKNVGRHASNARLQRHRSAIVRAVRAATDELQT